MKTLPCFNSINNQVDQFMKTCLIQIMFIASALTVLGGCTKLEAANGGDMPVAAAATPAPAPAPDPAPAPAPAPASAPPGLPAGWTLDPSMSDDFNMDGGVLDRSKWATFPHPNRGDRRNCVFNYTDAANPVDSEGLHIKTTHTSGVNWDIGNMVAGKFRTPPNYYMEFKWRPDVSGQANPDFWTWGDCGQNHFCEIDWPEFGWIQWVFWKGTLKRFAAASVADQHVNIFWFRPEDGNWHTHGKLHLNGVQYFYLDGILVYHMNDPYPEYTNASDFPQFWGGIQGGCPVGGVNADSVWQYIRVYHQ